MSNPTLITVYLAGLFSGTIVTCFCVFFVYQWAKHVAKKHAKELENRVTTKAKDKKPEPEVAEAPKRPEPNMPESLFGMPEHVGVIEGNDARVMAGILANAISKDPHDIERAVQESAPEDAVAHIHPTNDKRLCDRCNNMKEGTVKRLPLHYLCKTCAVTIGIVEA